MGEETKAETGNLANGVSTFERKKTQKKIYGDFKQGKGWTTLRKKSVSDKGNEQRGVRSITHKGRERGQAHIQKQHTGTSRPKKEKSHFQEQKTYLHQRNQRRDVVDRRKGGRFVQDGHKKSCLRRGLEKKKHVIQKIRCAERLKGTKKNITRKK